MSASIMGREYGGWERRVETVDFPVAMEPVRPMRSMVAGGEMWDVEEGRVGVDGCSCARRGAVGCSACFAQMLMLSRAVLVLHYGPNKLGLFHLSACMSVGRHPVQIL